MKTEDVIDTLGFGLFQIRLLCMTCIAAALVGATFAATVFLTYSPDYRCAIPGLENDSYHPVDEWHRNLINLTIPKEDGSCNTYNVDWSLYPPTSNTSHRSEEWETMAAISLMKCNRWVFDTSVFENTQVTEFAFVCDDEIKIAHGKTIFFAGKLIGALLFGLLGDRFGRKISLLLSLATTVASSLGVPWTPNFLSFMILRLLIGAGSTGLYINIFVLVVEFMGRKRRVLAAASVVISWVIGKLFVIAVAYFVRDWKTLQLAVHVPFVLTFVYLWFVPESVRWLVTHGRHRDAESALRRIAKLNNKPPLPEKFLDGEVKQEREKRESLSNIFTSRQLLSRFLISITNWMICCMVLYGLTFNAEKLGGDMFVNFSATILVEAPSYLIVIFLVDRTGRKRLYISAMLIGGASCVGTLFPVLYDKTGLQALTLTLSTIGKTAVTGAYFIVYICTPELFPTTLRLSIMGFSSCTARIGVMAGIYIAELGKLIGGNIGVAFPLVTFGGFTVLAGVLSVFLPETKGLQLPETVADAKLIRRQSQRKDKVEIEVGKPLKEEKTTNKQNSLLHSSVGEDIGLENIPNKRSQEIHEQNTETPRINAPCGDDSQTKMRNISKDFTTSL